MHVKGLDHVNIIAADLDETARFYESLLGLRVGRPAGVPAGFDGRWLFDEADRPIIHVMAYNEDRHGKEENRRSTHRQLPMTPANWLVRPGGILVCR